MLKRCVMVGLASACVILANAHLVAQENATMPQRIVIRAARLIDGKSDAVVKDAAVLVEGERITALGPGLAIPPEARVIDLGDATLLPGLIDAHTHLLEEMDGTMSWRKTVRCCGLWLPRAQLSALYWAQS